VSQVRHADRGRRATRLGVALPAAGLLSAGLLAGCIAPHSPQPDASRWPAQQRGQVTVTILTGTDTSDSAGDAPIGGASGMYQQLQNWWNTYEKGTGISIKFATVSGGATAEHSEMLADAEAGNSAYDIYNLDNEWVPEFAAADLIWPLQGHLPHTDTFLKLPLQSGEYEGQLDAVPFTTDVGLLYYRPSLISASEMKLLNSGHLSFPRLLHLASQVMSEKHVPVGYVGQFADYEGLTVNLLEIAHGEDPGMFAGNGTIADQGGLATALSELAAFVTPGTAGVLPGSELDYEEADAEAAFAEGDAVFMRNWPIYYGQIRAATVGTGAAAAKDFRVMPLPFPSVLGGQDLAISKSDPDPAAALTALQYLTSPSAEQCLFQAGGFPATRASAYASGTRPGGYGTQRQPLCVVKSPPPAEFGQMVEQAIAHAFLRPRTPYYTEFSSILQSEVTPELRDPTSDISGFVATLTSTLNNAATTGKAPPTLAGGASTP
jgi:multiple sugar transport system substrate-binding protein